MSDKKQFISEPQFYERLGARIKQLRLEADFVSAESFSREYGIGRTQYLGYEKGRNMELSTLIKLARIHGITVEELLLDIEK